MRSRKPRTILEIYMVILKTASEKTLSTNRLASYCGLGFRTCEAYMLAMEAQGLIISHRNGKRIYWSTTLEGVRLAVDIENVFDRAGIELRNKKLGG